MLAQRYRQILIVFMETYPDVDADYQSRVIEKSSERENIVAFPQNTKLQQHIQHNKNVTADSDAHNTRQSVSHGDFHRNCISMSHSESYSTSPDIVEESLNKQRRS